MSRKRKAAVVATLVAVAIMIAGAVGIAASIPGGLFSGNMDVTAGDQVAWVSTADGTSGGSPTLLGCEDASGDTDVSARGSSVVSGANILVLTIAARPGDVCTFSGDIADLGPDPVTINGLTITAQVPDDDNESGAPDGDESSGATGDGDLHAIAAARDLNSEGQQVGAWQSTPFTLQAINGQPTSFTQDEAVEFSVTVSPDLPSGTYEIAGSFDASYAGSGAITPTSAPPPVVTSPSPAPPSSPPASSPPPAA